MCVLKSLEKTISLSDLERLVLQIIENLSYYPNPHCCLFFTLSPGLTRSDCCSSYEWVVVLTIKTFKVRQQEYGEHEKLMRANSISVQIIEFYLIKIFNYLRTDIGTKENPVWNRGYSVLYLGVVGRYLANKYH